MDKVVIGTRGSILALWQANFIKSKLEHFGIFCEIKIIKTTGDKILDAPLSKIGGKGLFTKELEEQLLSGNIDIAVHSLKDVPISLPEGLILASITKREDVRDCFVSYKYENISALPKNAKVGTTSLRRAMQLKYMRNDIQTLSLRGNVQTRLSKLQNGEFDAIILAKAALNRLNLKQEIKFIKPLDISIMIPAMGQGALGIEARVDCCIMDKLRILDDARARIECEFERKFVALLDGGCQVPIGVNVNYENNIAQMRAIIGLPDGTKILKDEISGSKNDNLAQILFNKVEKQGARAILKQAFEMIN